MLQSRSTASTVIRLFLGVALILAGLGFVTVEAVTAQSAQNETGTIVDSNLRVLDTSIDDATVTLELEADRPKSVTVADVSTFMETGPVVTKQFDVSPGKSQIQMTVGKYRGWAGISISTEQGSWSKMLRSQEIIGGPWSGSDVQIAVISSAGAMSLFVFGLLYTRSRNRKQETGRIK